MSFMDESESGFMPDVALFASDPPVDLEIPSTVQSEEYVSVPGFPSVGRDVHPVIASASVEPEVVHLGSVHSEESAPVEPEAVQPGSVHSEESVPISSTPVEPEAIHPGSSEVSACGSRVDLEVPLASVEPEVVHLGSVHLEESVPTAVPDPRVDLHVPSTSVEFMDVAPETVHFEESVEFPSVVRDIPPIFAGDPLQVEPFVLPLPLVEESVPISVGSEPVILPPPVGFEDPIIVTPELVDPVPLDLSSRVPSPEHGAVSIFFKSPVFSFLSLCVFSFSLSVPLDSAGPRVSAEGDRTPLDVQLDVSLVISI